MKIFIISDFYPPLHMGGYEIRCKETADEIARRGHEIVVLTSRYGTDQGRVDENVHRLLFYSPLSELTNSVYSVAGTQAQDNIAGTTRERITAGLSAIVPAGLRKRFNQLRWAVSCRKNLRISRDLVAATRPDLIFVWNMGDIGLAPVWGAQQFGIPTVFSLGDYWLIHLKADLNDETNYFKKMFRLLIMGIPKFSRFDFSHLLVIGSGLRQGHIDGGFPPENVQVIPRGISSDLVLQVDELGDLPRTKNGHLKLLFVGRIIADKAPDLAIEAVNSLKNEHGMKDIELDLAGQGPQDYIEQLHARLKDLDLEKNVRFLGMVARSRIFELYREYDALIFPSRWVEPFGGTVLESMSQGLPVIASRRGGPAEIIVHGENGLLFPPEDAAGLAQAVLELAQDEAFTQKIRAASINTIRANHILENIVDRNLEYFHSITRQP